MRRSAAAWRLIVLIALSGCGDLQVGLGPPPGGGDPDPPSVDAGRDPVDVAEARADVPMRDGSTGDVALDASEVDAHDHATDHDAGAAMDAETERDARSDDAALRADASDRRDTGAAVDAGPLGFGAVYKAIVRDGCGCHTSAPFLGGLDLRTEDVAFESLLGMPAGSAAATSSECVDAMRVRVVPGNPAASLLWQKVQSLDDRLRCGARMPQGGAPLSAEDVDLVLEWIAEGALR